MRKIIIVKVSNGFILQDEDEDEEQMVIAKTYDEVVIELQGFFGVNDVSEDMPSPCADQPAPPWEDKPTSAAHRDDFLDAEIKKPSTSNECEAEVEDEPEEEIEVAPPSTRKKKQARKRKKICPSCDFRNKPWHDKCESSTGCTADITDVEKTYDW